MDIIESGINEVENEKEKDDFRSISSFRMLFHFLTHKIVANKGWCFLVNDGVIFCQIIEYLLDFR